MYFVLNIGIILISIVYESTGQHSVLLQAPPYAVKGSSYQLTCTVEPNVIGVEWYKSTGSGITSVGQVGASDCRSSGDPSLYNMTCDVWTTERGEYVLTILNVSSSDRGVTWRCLTVSTNPTYRSNGITIVIAVPPSPPTIRNAAFWNGVLQVMATESQPTALTCESIGTSPTPNITWMTKGTTLVTSRQIRISYNFTPIWTDHQQEYSCIASNIALVTPYNTTIRLFVTFSPKLLSIMPNISATEGQKNLQFTCPEIKANPSTGLTYKWTKSGVQLGTAQKLVINNVSRSNAGQYTCRITNSIGTSEPSTMFLNVFYPSQVLSLELNGSSTVQEGSNVELKCAVDSKPASNVVWFNLDTLSILRTDDNITQSDLTLPAMTCRDTGQYACSAYNGIGESSNRTLHLRVLCAPKIVEINGRVDNVSINIGSEIVVSLTLMSNPKPTIKWFHQLSADSKHQPVLFASDEVQNSGVVYTAKLKKDIESKADLGLYTASVLNTHGYVEHTFRVFEQIDRGNERARTGKGEDNACHDGHFYDGLNTSQINKTGNTYDEIQVKETVAGSS